MKKCRESTDEKMYNFVKDRDGKTHKFIIPNHLINPPDKTAVCNTALIDSAFKFNSANRNKLMTFLKDKRLGDNPSREMFINDVESSLGIFDEDESKSREQMSAQLKDIKKQSDKLISLLGRNYPDTDWWIIEGMISVSSDIKINESTYKQVKGKIELLRDSCEWSIDAIKPKKQYRKPGKNREFISQIAGSFFKRFSKKPSPSRGGIFEQVLDKVAALSCIEINIGEKILKSVISNTTY